MDVPEQINIPVDWPAARSPLSRTLADHARAINQSLDYDEGDPRYYGAIGDGVTDDTASVQAAFTHGGRVIISKPYKVTQTINFVLDGTSVFGYCGKLIHETASLLDVLYGRELEDIDIIGLEIDGRKALKSTASVNGARGIHLYGCTRARVLSCYIHDCYEHGIRIGQETADPAASNTILVSDNIIKDNGNDTNHRGWAVWGFGKITNLVVSGNICIDNEGGIIADDVSGSGTPGNDNLNVVFDGNLVYSTLATYGASTKGLQVSGTTQFTMTGNRTNGYQVGIGVTSGQAGTLTGYGTITGNDVDAEEYGLWIWNATQVVVSGNRFEVSVTNGASGIDITSTSVGAPCEDIIIDNNLIVSSEDGILHGVSSAQTGNNITIRGNTIRCTDVGVSPIGVRVLDATNVTIIDNEISDFLDGIETNSAVVYPLIKGNYIHDCTEYGLELSTPSLVLQNTMRNNATADFRSTGTFNDATTIIKDNELLSTTPTSGSFSSTVRQNNYGLHDSSDVEVATGIFDCDPNIYVTQINSIGGAVTATLGSGAQYGQQKMIVMVQDSNSSTLSVTNHVTSDPEVFTFDAVDEALLLQWTGTEWMTIHAQDVTT